MDEIKAILQAILHNQEMTRAEIAGIKTEIAGIKADIAGIKNEIAEIKADMNGLRLEVADLRTKMNKHFDAAEPEMRFLKRKSDRFEADLYSTMDRVDAIEQQLNR